MLRYMLLVVGLVVGCFGVSAGDVIQGTDTGGVNWSKGTIFASGYGVAADSVPNRKKRLLARRAAQIDAYRNLAEIVSGVRVNSETSVKDLELASDVIRTKLDAVVKGAVIIKDVYQNEIAEVVIEVKMNGSFIETVSKNQVSKAQASNYSKQALGEVFNAYIKASFSPIIKLPKLSMMRTANAAEMTTASVVKPAMNESNITLLREIKEKIITLPKEQSLAYIEQKIASYEKVTQFSGLLIDAQQVDQFELATIPKLRTQDGKVIYPTEEMMKSEAFTRRPVSYDFNVDDAVENKRVAYTPYIIKALGTYKSRKSDLVVADEVALFIKNNSHIATTLDKASVMIVVAQ
jgi:hypothetical protein